MPVDGGGVLPPEYFKSGVFRNTAPGEIFLHYTCNVCGTRLKTWASFKAHRASNDCRAIGDTNTGAQPGWLTDGE